MLDGFLRVFFLTELKADTGYSGGEVWQVDFGSFASVSAFADRADRELDRLDILVENAAATNWGPFEFTEDGWEKWFRALPYLFGLKIADIVQFSLEANCLGQELLAFRLLPLLKRTAEQHPGSPRLVIVTSGVFFTTDIPEVILNEPKILEGLNKPELCMPKPKENNAPDPDAFGNIERYSHTKRRFYTPFYIPLQIYLNFFSSKPLLHPFSSIPCWVFHNRELR